MESSEQMHQLAAFPADFKGRLADSGSLTPLSLRIFQVNVGKRCNQACRHCHVDASPARTEAMTREIMDTCLEVLRKTPEFAIVDITGGAPEMNPDFRYLVEQVRGLGRHIIDRCNLTILEEPGYDYLYGFLREHEVEITASLPHFSEAVTDRQRGGGVFKTSIEALRKLNALGYGSELPLNLVYNPGGFFLSSSQAQLEHEFKARLRGEFGVEFNSLYCINNMPISRFLESMIRRGKFQEYMDVLASAYNPGTLEGLMCRHQISVGWDGAVYDCDFNQMLELPSEPISHISEFDRDAFLSRTIRIANHCYGCTAGAGSSCGGEITKQ
ncbi:MAG: arsenosugar biosynthesis radical SAM protein ArsS [Fibrobacterota bacterium]|nr:arsenosugar biosynthesis radical SAM protein ArsS [Fibrobacterota bacterium]